jgi:hypothetical protein
MALGRSQAQQRFENPREILGDRLKEGSIYRLLADHGHQLFDDDYFADLYNESVRGRPTIAARVMATVMLLQAFEGLSDADATDRLSFDLRWQAAAGVDTGYESFHPTSLVGQRNRLRSSERPRRLFEDTKALAKETGALKSRARALDSTPQFWACISGHLLISLVGAFDLRVLLRVSRSLAYRPPSACPMPSSTLFISEQACLRKLTISLLPPRGILRHFRIGHSDLIVFRIVVRGMSAPSSPHGGFPVVSGGFGRPGALPFNTAPANCIKNPLMHQRRYIRVDSSIAHRIVRIGGRPHRQAHRPQKPPVTCTGTNR